MKQWPLISKKFKISRLTLNQSKYLMRRPFQAIIICFEMHYLRNLQALIPANLFKLALCILFLSQCVWKPTITRARCIQHSILLVHPVGHPHPATHHTSTVWDAYIIIHRSRCHVYEKKRLWMLQYLHLIYASEHHGKGCTSAYKKNYYKKNEQILPTLLILCNTALIYQRSAPQRYTKHNPCDVASTSNKSADRIMCVCTCILFVSCRFLSK